MKFYLYIYHLKFQNDCYTNVYKTSSKKWRNFLAATYLLGPMVKEPLYFNYTEFNVFSLRSKAKFQIN